MFTTSFTDEDDSSLQAQQPDKSSTAQQHVQTEQKKEDDTNSSADCIRIVAISDTHNMHNRHAAFTTALSKLYRSPNDILIHAGDFSESGSKNEILAIDQWFAQLPFQHIFIISGNMDGISLDGDSVDGHVQFKHAVYLQHEAYTLKFEQLNGFQLTLFGSPYTPEFVGGFQISNDKMAQKLWSEIPANTDIVVVHGPAKGILDRTSSGWSVGDAVLREEILQRVRPKAMIFGHVHASHGSQVVQEKGKSAIHFVNAAMYDKLVGMNQKGDFEPFVLEIPIKEKQKAN